MHSYGYAQNLADPSARGDVLTGLTRVVTSLGRRQPMGMLDASDRLGPPERPLDPERGSVLVMAVGRWFRTTKPGSSTIGIGSGDAGATAPTTILASVGMNGDWAGIGPVRISTGSA